MAAGPLAEYRLLSEPHDDGLFATAPAVRDDGTEVTVRVVVAKLDRTQLRRVREEAAALDNVLAVSKNPFVLPLLHHDRDADGRPVLVTARRGRSLGDELAAHGPLPVAEMLGALIETATGLELLHRNETLHQAVSPAALLRQPTGRVVLDCPLLPVLAEIAATTGDTGHEPPEVLAGQDWTPAGEVYALASTLWTLLSGTPPFFGSRAERVLFAGQNPLGRLPEAAAQLTPALQWALSTEPGARPQSVADFARRLRDRKRAERQGHGSGGPARSLGEYDLLARIGDGGMGTVWRARQRSDGELVAVKLLRPELATDADSLMRLVREGSVLQDISHPNLVRVRDLYIARGRGEAAVVMDLIDGVDLRQLLAAEEVGRADGARLLSGVAAGLNALHESGIVHRDFKPANILVRDQNGRRQALLTDFGLAKAIDDASVTRLGIPGSPFYLAPEVINREPPSPASDIYALGVTAYEVLTGRRPFGGTTEEVLRHHQLSQPPRPPHLLDSEWLFLARCLAKDPRDRPGTLEAAELLGDLATEIALTEPGQQAPAASAADTVVMAPAAPPWLDVPPPVDPHAVAVADPVPTETSALPPHPRPAEPPTRRSSRRWLILAAAVMLVAVVGTCLGLWLGQERSGRQGISPPTSAPSSTTDHRVPVTVARDGDRVSVSWPPRSGGLPGLVSFVVFRNGQVLEREVAVDVFSVQDWNPPPSACYVVIALGVSSPSEPSAGPACLSSPTSPSR